MRWYAKRRSIWHNFRRAKSGFGTPAQARATSRNTPKNWQKYSPPTPPNRSAGPTRPNPSRSTTPSFAPPKKKPSSGVLARYNRLSKQKKEKLRGLLFFCYLRCLRNSANAAVSFGCHDVGKWLAIKTSKYCEIKKCNNESSRLGLRFSKILEKTTSKAPSNRLFLSISVLL